MSGDAAQPGDAPTTAEPQSLADTPELKQEPCAEEETQSAAMGQNDTSPSESSEQQNAGLAFLIILV